MKTAVKRVLSLIGYNHHSASEMGMNAVRSSDTFIVSYPKSGNTWVRFLLANAMRPERVATFHDLDSFVPDLHKCRARVDHSASPRFIKTHHAYCGKYPRFIYICRDGRDVMVSFYHFERDRFKGSFSEFIRSRNTHVFGQWHWHEHVSAALIEAKARPRNVLFIRFEDFLAKPLQVSSRIIKFCSIDVSESVIEEVSDRCLFHRLQEIEKTYGGSDVDLFMRKGSSNQWIEYFSNDDIEYFHEQAGETLKLAGYF